MTGVGGGQSGGVCVIAKIVSFMRIISLLGPQRGFKRKEKKKKKEAPSPSWSLVWGEGEGEGEGAGG